MSSDCEQMKDQIADHISGILSEAQVQSLELHFNECKSCREYARALSKEDALLTDLFAEIEIAMTNQQEQILRKVNQLCVSKQNESPLIRRIIMKNQITKTATVLVIVIAIGAIATAVGLKARKYYFAGRETDGSFSTYKFKSELETIEHEDGSTEVRGTMVGITSNDPNFTIDVEQKIKDLEEIDLLRQQDDRELMKVIENEVNGKLQPRTFIFKYVLENGSEETIGEGDPDTRDRERSLTDAQRDELLQLRIERKGKDLTAQEKEVQGRIFSFKRKHFVLSDGTEIIVSTGSPK